MESEEEVMGVDLELEEDLDRMVFNDSYRYADDEEYAQVILPASPAPLGSSRKRCCVN